MDCFRFTGAPGENVRIEFDGTLSFGARELFRPDGTEVSPCCVLDAAGTHRIIVGSFIGTGTGNYSISIQRLSNPVGCTSIAFGDPPASGAVSGLADMDCVTFTGSLGDAIDIHTVSVDVAEIDLQLYDPSGQFICSTTVGAQEGDNRSCRLTTDGQQTIVLTSPDAPASYRLAIQRLNGPVGCSDLDFTGISTLGTLGFAEMDCYTFDAVAGDTMRLRHAKTGGNFTPIFVLADPDGGSLSSECTQSAAELNCSLGATGTYTVLVLDSSSSGGGSGTYAIALQRPNNPGNCTSLSFGAAPVAASIGQPAEMDCFRFSGAPADRIQMAVAVATGATLSRDVDVFAPEGGLICSAPSAPCFLENAGMHTILVDDSNGAGTGSYGIAVQRLNNPPGPSCTALSFGAAPTSASIGAAGEMDCYCVLRLGRRAGQGPARDHVRRPLSVQRDRADRWDAGVPARHGARLHLRDGRERPAPDHRERRRLRPGHGQLLDCGPATQRAEQLCCARRTAAHR